MNEYLEKLRSIGHLGRAPKSHTKTERVDGAVIAHTEHADGRVDANVRPDTIRLHATQHNTGARKGEVAEIAPLNAKERKERYGDQV